MKDWSDLRILVAVVRVGSLAAASRELGIHHVTVGRRLSALEAELGVKLIDRLPRRAVPTAAGTQIAELAGEIEMTVDAISRRGRGERSQISGIVSISAPPLVAVELIAPALAPLLSAEPDLRIILRASANVASLARGEADIAVRLIPPDQPGLIARRVTQVDLGLYAAPGYEERAQKSWRFIAYDETLLHVPHSRWFESYIDNRPVVLRSSDVYVQLAAARAGIGVALLPNRVAGSCQDLVLIDKAAPAPRDAWLVVHPDLRKSPAVRVVLDTLAAALGSPHGEV
jgi:DNA-binding transcriptional LysR family regulator